MENKNVLSGEWNYARESEEKNCNCWQEQIFGQRKISLAGVDGGGGNVKNENEFVCLEREEG